MKTHLASFPSQLLRLLILLVAFSGVLNAADPVDSTIEHRVGQAVQSPGVTIVHFWAPWCPNCRHELTPAGWSRFLSANPAVHVVFVTIWSDDPGTRVLQKAGLGTQPNLTILQDPNGSRQRSDRTNTFLGLPVPWIPTTWIYRDGNLLYALDYGELHFPILQQFVDDATAHW